MNISDYFSSKAYHYKTRSHRSVFKFIRQYETKTILRELEGVEYEALLDLGCGTGHYSKLMSRKAKWVSLNDLSIEMLNQIDFHVDEKICGDMSSLKSDKKFDLITVLGALEFCDDPETTIKNSIHHLNDNGHFLIMVPGSSLVGQAYKAYYGFKGFGVKLFKKDALAKILRNVGLDIISIKTAGPINFLVLGRKSIR